MNLVYKKYNLRYEFNSNQLTSIVLEHPRILENFILDLYNQLGKVEDSFILTNDNTQVPFEKEVELIISPLDFAYNGKAFQKKLFDYLISQSQSTGSFEKILEALGIIAEQLHALDMQIEYNIDFSESIGIADVMKIFSVNMKNPEGTFVEKLIEYAITTKRLLGKSTFFIINCDAYIKGEEYKYMEKMTNYYEINLLLIRNNQICGETVFNEYITDIDLCMIH